MLFHMRRVRSVGRGVLTSCHLGFGARLGIRARARASQAPPSLAARLRVGPDSSSAERTKNSANHHDEPGAAWRSLRQQVGWAHFHPRQEPPLGCEVRAREDPTSNAFVCFEETRMSSLHPPSPRRGEEVRELFERYGRIRDVYLPRACLGSGA